MTSAAFLVLMLLLTCTKGQAVPEPPLRYPAKIYPRGSCPSQEDMVNLKNEFRQNLSELLTTHSCGGPGWRRVAYLDMTDPSQSCPPGLALRVYSPGVRACGRESDFLSGLLGCSSTFYTIGNAEYSRVCGRVRGYQYNNAHALFSAFLSAGIDSFYVTGVSLTHGQSGSRTHIWTFAVGSDNTSTNLFGACPCATPHATSPPPDFVGNDYFCESGTETRIGGGAILYADDPLWDGQNCTSSCCEFNNPPYFTKTLPTPTTDDIELRICSLLLDDDVPIDQVEIYVQ